jgi:hypothetical protein
MAFWLAMLAINERTGSGALEALPTPKEKDSAETQSAGEAEIRSRRCLRGTPTDSLGDAFQNQALVSESSPGQRRKHRLRGMGDHGEKRPGRPARHALALFPVPDGFDRHS